MTTFYENGKIANYKALTEYLTNMIILYLSENNLKSMILGISGGIDSTVCAALCNIVNIKSGYELVGISMPSETNQDIEDIVANKVLENFCNVQKTQSIEYEFKTIRDSEQKMFDEKLSALALGNIKARIRMIHLYSAANIYNGIVIDTDNLSEHYLGFFTIHGDQGDLNPIGKLWKTQIYEYADWLSNSEYFNEYQQTIIKASMVLTPTDGNGVKDGGDMAQIAPGYTYTDVDKIIKQYIFEQSFSLYNDNEAAAEKISEELDIPKNTVLGVINRIKNSKFKRRKLPIVIDLMSTRFE